MPTVAEIMAFFFRAMVNGYADPNRKKTGIPQLPGYKLVYFDEGKFVLVDMWHTTPGSKISSGTTTIWYNGIVVWVMHYGGWYEESVIPFLKRALMRNYEQAFFLGGRGPDRLEGEDHALAYFNKVEKSGFADFKGQEEIISMSQRSGFPLGQKLGQHDYFGMLMI